MRQCSDPASVRKISGRLAALAKYDSILFDFDGVLCDSEPLHFRCWKQVLAGFGVDLQWDWFANSCIGVSEHDTLQAFRSLATPPLDFDALWAQYPRKKELFRQIVAEGIVLTPGVKDLLDELRGRYRMAVVSSSNRKEIEPALEGGGVREYFDVLVCGTEAGRLKPAPDPYERAAQLLESKIPLVVEDSAAGVASAQAAGFEFVRIRSVEEMVAAVRSALEE